MRDNQAFDRGADLVTAENFYRDDHRRIWRHIAKLIEASKPADVVTVSESIEGSEDKDKTGGPAYLGALAQNTPTALNIRRYAELVRERAVQRRLAQVATGIAEEALNPGGKEVGQLLDEAESKIVQMTSGMQPGDLVIVAARPSMGKTALALNIAEHVAVDNGLPVAVFSMEMSSTQLAMRMLGSIARVDQHKMRTGRLNDKEWGDLSDAMGKLHETPLFIDEGGALTALEVRARARRLKRQYSKLGLIVIDYLQLMASTTQGENRATEISEISRSLKAMAKELDVPVIALSQLNRALEQRPNKRPQMADLRESGAIEQDADVIFFIYRDEVYNPDSADKGKAEIIIGKQRNGPIGMVPLTFLGQYTRFENFASGRF